MSRSRCRVVVLAAFVAFAVPLVPDVAAAADVPVAVTKLLLKDAGDPATRRARVVVKNAAGLDVAALDPTASGAALEVVGGGSADDSADRAQDPGALLGNAIAPRATSTSPTSARTSGRR